MRRCTFFQPGLLGNVGFNANGPDYRIRGVETSFIAVLTQGLTAEGGAAWNSSEQTNSPFLIANNPDLLGNPASAGQYGQPITTGVNHQGCLVRFRIRMVPRVHRAAFAPPLQFNARLRYQWVMSSYQLFAQAGATHTAHSFTQSGSQPPARWSTYTTNYLRFENPAYTEYDASIGSWEGCLVGGGVRAEPHQRHYEHVHLDLAVRAAGDHHPTAGTGDTVRLQVLIWPMGSR